MASWDTPLLQAAYLYAGQQYNVLIVKCDETGGGDHALDSVPMGLLSICCIITVVVVGRENEKERSKRKN